MCFEELWWRFMVVRWRISGGFVEVLGGLGVSTGCDVFTGEFMRFFSEKKVGSKK